MPYVVPYDMVITDVFELPYVAPHVALYVLADILCTGFYQNPLIWVWQFFPLVQRVSSLKHVMKSTTKKRHYRHYQCHAQVYSPG